MRSLEVASALPIVAVPGSLQPQMILDDVEGDTPEHEAIGFDAARGFSDGSSPYAVFPPTEITMVVWWTSHFPVRSFGEPTEVTR